MNEEHVRDAAKMTDSRDKLEADAQSTANAIYLMVYDDGVAQSGRDSEPVRVGTQWITELLDRQAAITANETSHDNPYVGLVRGKQWERTEISDYYCGRCGWKVTDHDSYCPECGGAFHKASNKPDSKFDARKTAETPETDAAKGDIRDFADSREKLEADMREYFSLWMGGTSRTQAAIIGWLDRQAAIVERYWREQVDALAAKGDQLAEANAELRQQVGELTAELAKRDKGIARLKRRRDELERALEIDGRIKVSQDAAIEEIAKQRDEARAELENARQGQGERGHVPIGGEPDSAPENGDCDREGGFEWLVSQIEWYADECARLERLNAELRDKLSEAIGHAWAIVQSQDLSAADMEGGVVE